MSKQAKDSTSSSTPEPGELPPYMTPSLSERNPLSREEAMQLGQEAATLLAAPIFNHAYRATMDQLMETWMTTEDREQRDFLWTMVQGLAEVTRHLLANVNAAQALTLSEEQMAEQDLRRYEDEQGFV